jgi:hypothetical protein
MEEPLSSIKYNKIAYCAVKPEDIAANHSQQVTAQSGNINSFSSREIRDEFKEFFITTGLWN